MFSPSSVTKLLVITLKGSEPVIFCVIDKTHVRDRVFNLMPIHASVIYQFL